MKNKYEKTKAIRHKEKLYACKDECSNIVFVSHEKPTLVDGVFTHSTSSNARFDYIDADEKSRLGIPPVLPLEKPILYEIVIRTIIKKI